MITNEDVITWKPLVCKVAHKYKNNIYKIESEDLEQIAYIGLIKGLEAYEEGRGASLKTYLYNKVEWEIKREFENLRRVKRQGDYNAVSLQTPMNSEEEIMLEDVIQDDTIDIENEVVNKVDMDIYKKEIELVLDEKKQYVISEYYLKSRSYADISKDLNMTGERVRQLEARALRELRNKSKVIRSIWLERKEKEAENDIVSMYRNPSDVIYLREISNNLRVKYHKEIAILNFIQEITDGLFSYSRINEKIKDFYINSIDGTIDPEDSILFKEVVINKTNYNTLEKKGYDFIDTLNIKDKVKKNILENKEDYYNLWVEYNNSIINNDSISTTIQGEQLCLMN